jgi:GNAT superfamily N-acetyltransferase
MIPSTDPDCTRSNIVAHLSKGSGVVISRGAVYYVVTEYGVAYLYGKSIQERVIALCAIAHPDFRESLFKEAIEARYIRPELADMGRKFLMPADESLQTTMLLDDGTQINFRSIQPTDEPSMRDLFYDLSRETIYYRFMSREANFTHKQIQDFFYVDHRHDVAIIGTVPEAYGENIIAVGRYFLDETTNRAEIALVVRDDWQNRGIGSFLFHHLADLAKANGIAGFSAEILRENQRMQTIINHAGYRTTTRLERGVYSFSVDF